jgi:toxin-antitoxin system PIN domain toxin
VILVDANLLLYAYDSDSPQHRSARAWLENQFAGQQPIALAWTTVLAFMRISTSRLVGSTPLQMEQAVAIVSDWLALSNVEVLSPGQRHWPILGRLLTAAQVRGPLIMDAHLAALAIENGATLCTNDRDFSRFPGLRVEYPLQ